jgi:hypothetical protein
MTLTFILSLSGRGDRKLSSQGEPTELRKEILGGKR